jgi:hypothetical protein
MKHDGTGDTSGRRSRTSEEFGNLYKAMKSEVNFLAKVHPAENEAKPTEYPDPVALNQIERRVLVRSILAFIEAMTYAMKNLVLRIDDSAIPLSEQERLLAMEVTCELDHSGRAQSRPAKLRTLPNVRFAFSLAAKAFPSDVFLLDLSGDRLQALERSIKVRDRLTHPKSDASLLVSDDEISEAFMVYVWFDHQLICFLGGVVHHLTREGSKEFWEELKKNEA